MDNNLNNNFNNELNAKSNNYSKLITACLAILLIGAIGFICYDKFINTEKPPVPTPTPTSTDTNDNSNLPKWISYLLEKNIKTMGYYDENNNWKTISHDQLKGYLQKLSSDYSLYKEKDYDGGCSGYCGLQIEYNNIAMRIYAGSIIFQDFDGKVEDSELLSLLENEKYTLYDNLSSYNTWHFAFYRNITQDGSKDTLEIDEYINSNN